MFKQYRINDDLDVVITYSKENSGNIDTLDKAVALERKHLENSLESNEKYKKEIELSIQIKIQREQENLNHVIGCIDRLKNDIVKLEQLKDPTE